MALIIPMMDTPTNTSKSENPLLFFVMFVILFVNFIIAPPLKHWQTLAVCTNLMRSSFIYRNIYWGFADKNEVL